MIKNLPISFVSKKKYPPQGGYLWGILLCLLFVQTSIDATAGTNTLNPNPDANCKNIDVYLDAYGNATITPEDIDGGSTSADGGPLFLFIDQDTFDCSNLGKNKVRLIVVDTYDNLSLCNAEVWVYDTIAPVPDEVTLTDVTAQCTVNESDLIIPTATDNCSGTVSATPDVTFPITTQGTTVITWTFTDASGNTSSQTQNIIIEDTLAPTPDSSILPDIEAQCEVTEADVTPPTATDNCSGTVTVTSDATFPIAGQGTTTITWTFEDESGNKSTQTQDVSISDILPPVPDISDFDLEPIYRQCELTAADLPVLTATDECSGTVIGMAVSPSFPITNQGAGFIWWMYGDANGNYSFQMQTYIIDDTEAPVADVASLPDVTAECSATLTTPTATDNCKGTITGTTSDPTNYSDQGTYTVTWTYDDGNGNASNQTQNVIIDDITPPATPVLADAEGECSVSVTAPTTTDNCAGTIIGKTSDPLTYDAQGTYTITWTFSDGNGNSTTANQTVIVDDITAPVADFASLPDVTAECSATLTAPTATDNCEGTITGTTSDPTSYSALGTYTVTWTYDDGNGNSSNQTQNVIIDDMTPPVAPVLADAVGECSVTVTAPTTTDNCTGTIIGTTSDPLTYDAQGTYTITWAFSDGNGNSTTANQTVIVDDITAPVADVASLPDVTAECSATLTAPTATDNCEGTITGTTSDPTNYSDQGTYKVTWTYDDGNGNSSNQTQNVIIDDITSPATPVLADAEGECSVSITAPTTTDNCVGTIIGTTSDQLTYDAQGTYTITWTFSDGNGNSTTANQTVIVDDITAPVADIASLPDVTAECSATLTAPTATDNCEGTITGTTSDPTSYSTLGTYSVTWTYDDGNGNSSNQTQNVIIDDITPPATPVLADVEGECSVSVTAPTTTDNCAGTIIGTTSNPLTYDAQGTYTIAWTFSDGNGNSTTANQTVIVDDITAPVADVASLPVVTAECSATLTAPTATDNCEGTITGTTSDPTNYSNQGTYTVTWTYDDGNGNSSTQEQSVIVDDTTAPVADVASLPDVTAECSATLTAPTATDNCEGAITGTTADPTSYAAQGTYTVTWTYDDGNGNSSTQEQAVIIDDTTAPVPDAATLVDITANCEVVEADVTAPTGTDNCSGTVSVTNNGTFPINTPGTTVITWTFEDENGNKSTQTQNIIIESSPVADVTFADASFTYDGTAHNLEVSGLPSGASVTYQNNNQTSAGTYEVTAIVNPGVTSCPELQLKANLTIDKAPQTITFDEIPVKNLENDPDFSLSATASSELAVTYNYDYTAATAPAIVSPEGDVTMQTSGVVEITASQEGDDNYLAADPVTRTLTIESSDATIHEITINGVTYTNPENEISYQIDCGDNTEQVTVSFTTTEINATADMAENFTIEASTTGTHTQEINVTSQDGTQTETYVITINKQYNYLSYSSLVIQKFNNVLLINNNPDNNGGYTFTNFEWYMDGVLVSTDQAYSAGNNVDNNLNPDATYYVILTDEEGSVFRTCDFTITLDPTFILTVSPNPATAGSSMDVTTSYTPEMLNDMTVQVTNLFGTPILQEVTFSNNNRISLPPTMKAGTYIVTTKAAGVVLSSKIIVK